MIIAARNRFRRDKLPIHYRKLTAQSARSLRGTRGTAARNCSVETMDVASIAMALIAAQVGQAQIDVAAKLAKMNAEQGQSVAKLLDAAQANFSQLANVAAGIGTNLDVAA